MARHAPDGLSCHPTKGFRITAGKTADGRPRLFWLGHDRVKAEYHAYHIRNCLAHMRRSGRDVWNDKDVADIKEAAANFMGTLTGLNDMYARDASDLDDRFKALQAEQEALKGRKAIFAATFGNAGTPGPTPPSDVATDAATPE
jgi:hypothetical protein